MPISAAESVLPSRTPPLITSSGLARAKSRRPLAASTGSPLTNAIAVGPVSSDSSSADSGVGRGALGERVLDDRVGGVAAQGTAQVADLLDREPAVLGDDRRGRVAEVLGDLGDRRELLGIRHPLPPLSCIGLGARRDENRPGAGRTGRQCHAVRCHPARVAPALRGFSIACAHATTSGLRVVRRRSYAPAVAASKSRPSPDVSRRRPGAPYCDDRRTGGAMGLERARAGTVLDGGTGESGECPRPVAPVPVVVGSAAVSPVGGTAADPRPAVGWAPWAVPQLERAVEIVHAAPDGAPAAARLYRQWFAPAVADVPVRWPRRPLVGLYRSAHAGAPHRRPDGHWVLARHDVVGADGWWRTWGEHWTPPRSRRGSVRVLLSPHAGRLGAFVSHPHRGDARARRAVVAVLRDRPRPGAPGGQRGARRPVARPPARRPAGPAGADAAAGRAAALRAGCPRGRAGRAPVERDGLRRAPLPPRRDGPAAPEQRVATRCARSPPSSPRTASTRPRRTATAETNPEQSCPAYISRRA